MSWISYNNEEEEETQLLTQHFSQQLKTPVYTAPAQSHRYHHQNMNFIPENHGGHEVKERPTKTVSLFENSCKCRT